ncbi:MAG: hypothetical protein ACOCP8_04190, partial [archaeon]
GYIRGGSGEIDFGSDNLITTGEINNITITGYTTDSKSIKIGRNAASSASGEYCVFIGSETGGGDGTNNVGIGRQVLSDLTSGGNNLGFGTISLHSITEGDGNTGFGYATLKAITTGNRNTAIGTGAGRHYGNNAGELTDSEEGIFIGKNSQPASNSSVNEVVIGVDAAGNGDNTITIGNDDAVETYLKGDVSLNSDNQKILLGDAQDGSIYHDGTDLFIDNEDSDGRVKIMGSEFDEGGYFYASNVYHPDGSTGFFMSSNNLHLLADGNTLLELNYEAIVDNTNIIFDPNQDGVHFNFNTANKSSMLKIDGVNDQIIVDLPTDDPQVDGALWNDGGTVKVSSG